MATSNEVLVFGCREDDLAVLAESLGSNGPRLSALNSTAELTGKAVSRRPLAIVLGVGTHSSADLDVIPVIRAVRKSLPVIVIADGDSIELERCAREMKIFYYLIHPIENGEVEAVLKDVLRFEQG